MVFEFKNTEITRPAEYTQALTSARESIAKGGPDEALPILKGYKAENREPIGITAVRIGDTENIGNIAMLLTAINQDPERNPTEILLNRAIQKGSAGVAVILAEKMQQKGDFEKVDGEIAAGYLLVEAVKHSNELTEKGLKGTEIVGKLLDLDLDINESYDSKGQLPLSRAIKNVDEGRGSEEMITYLASRGANPEDITVKKALKGRDILDLKAGASAPAPGASPQPTEAGAAQGTDDELCL